MANHYVNFKIPKSELGKADAVFSISDDDGKIGTLKISHGAIEWKPANNQYSRRLSWKQFNTLMQKEGTRVLTK
ncbi:MAG TPA: hypothetical protein PLB46_15725 [Chitinophagales bacterium]|nr:hypothetical protein [Chitinophagales bacterium]